MIEDVVAVVVAFLGAIAIGFLIGRRRDSPTRSPTKSAHEYGAEIDQAHDQAVGDAARDHGRDPDDVDEILDWADSHRRR